MIGFKKSFTKYSLNRLISYIYVYEISNKVDGQAKLFNRITPNFEYKVRQNTQFLDNLSKFFYFRLDFLLNEKVKIVKSSFIFDLRYKNFYIEASEEKWVNSENRWGDWMIA